MSNPTDIILSELDISTIGGALSVYIRMIEEGKFTEEASEVYESAKELKKLIKPIVKKTDTSYRLIIENRKDWV